MFSIFSYIMSRVTHSEPGLPMVPPAEFDGPQRQREKTVEDSGFKAFFQRQKLNARLIYLNPH